MPATSINSSALTSLGRERLLLITMPPYEGSGFRGYHLRPWLGAAK